MKRMMMMGIVSALVVLLCAVNADAQGTYAEDGSYIQDADSYYSQPTYDESDSYLVMTWTKGQTDACGYRTNSYSEANDMAAYEQSLGYASAVIHSTPSLDSKMPYCS